MGKLSLTVYPQKKRLVFDYPTKASPAAFEAYMDPNHSHFLLVDDGTYCCGSSHVIVFKEEF